MPDRITIRAESPDQPDVRSLLADLDRYLATLYPPDANHILNVEELLAPDVGFYVARDGDQVVGTAAFVRRVGESATHGRAYGEVKRMVVDPAHRSRGIGARLLDKLEAHLRDEGFALALLETGALQASAVRLYESCGYASRAAFGGYPDNGLSLFYGKVL